MQTDFFGGLAPRVNDGSIYQLRRKDLVEAIKQQHSDDATGMVVLFSAFEIGSERFRQDKTFYYYTGINEPGSVLVIDMDGVSTVYVPNCFAKRSQWMALPEALVNRDAKALNVDTVEFLGDECDGYMLNPYFSSHEYSCMITRIKEVVASGGSLFTTSPDNGYEYLQARFVLDHLQKLRLPT